MTERIKLTREYLTEFLEDHFLQSEEVFIQQVLDDQEKAEILEIGQEDSMFKVAKFCETLTEWKKENKELKELNTTLSKALAEEMAANFKCAHVKCLLEQKLDKIEALTEGYYDVSSSKLKEILQEPDEILDLAKDKANKGDLL